MDIIKEKLKLLPDSPGVYVMVDKYANVIYVGKAKVLKNRLRQYFFNNVKTLKVKAMVDNVADFYYYLTPTEIDALSLENNLIKKYKPRYNILLKDDKTYPYLRIDLKEDFAKFKVVRRVKKDGAKYFGPYMGGISVNEILEIVNSVFSLRTCNQAITGKAKKPCLNYQLKRCKAPCIANISAEEYRKSLNGAIEFLKGDIKGVQTLVTEKMLELAGREEFELALKYKNILQSLNKIGIKRLTSLNKFISADVISVADDGIYCAISALYVRNGRMLGGKNFSFESGTLSAEEAISEFLLRYYRDGVEIPEEIIINKKIENKQVIEEYLTGALGKQVTITATSRGTKFELSVMAENNAKDYLAIAVNKIKHKNDMTIIACKALKEKLNLSSFPRRMECYDISNISGVDKVGSMVVFINGEADKSQYRRFKIKTFEGADDYRAHQEMMTRRLEKLTTEPEKFPKPDLIIIDGGKGQLSAVKEVFDKKGVTDIDLIALAERDEEIFTLDSNHPILLAKSDYCLRMLQRLRDEAHRFAITYHVALRGKRSLSSVLDKIKGLGKVKKRALLEKFKDLSGIISADKTALMQVEGIGEIQAQNIIDLLTKEGLK